MKNTKHKCRFHATGDVFVCNCGKFKKKFENDCDWNTEALDARLRKGIHYTFKRHRARKKVVDNIIKDKNEEQESPYGERVFRNIAIVVLAVYIIAVLILILFKYFPL